MWTSPMTDCSSAAAPSSCRRTSGLRITRSTWPDCRMPTASRRRSFRSQAARLGQQQRPDRYRRPSMLNRGFHVVHRPVEVRVGLHPAAPAQRVIAAAPAANDSRVRHPVLTRALHWGTVIAIVVAVLAMFARDALEDK